MLLPLLLLLLHSLLILLLFLSTSHLNRTSLLSETKLGMLDDAKWLKCVQPAGMCKYMLDMITHNNINTDSQ